MRLDQLTEVRWQDYSIQVCALVIFWGHVKGPKNNYCSEFQKIYSLIYICHFTFHKSFSFNK